MNTADKAPGRPAPIDELKAAFENPAIVTGALLYLYGHQTDDEQASQSTQYQNDVGFNGCDAGVLSDIAQWYLKKGFLSEKQINFVKGKLVKYHRQLTPVEKIRPAENRERPGEKPAVQAYMKAGFQKEGTEIWVKWAGQDRPRWNDLLSLVKTLPGRRFLKEHQCWVMPTSEAAAKSLTEWGFELSDALREWWAKMNRPAAAPADIEIPGLLLPLRPFQRAGVAFIEDREGRAIVGDEMGLGKTCQAIGYLMLHPELRPAVIVCPANVKYNWEREIRKFAGPQSVQILSGRPDRRTPAPLADWIIVNYDILANETEQVVKTGPDGQPARDGAGRFIKEKVPVPDTGWADHLKRIKPKAIVADELHYTKNKGAARTKAFLKLARKCKAQILLSGTPIVNRPMEFYNAINLVRPSLFPSWFAFAQRYCGAKHNGFGWDFSGASNTAELHELLTSTVMIRRLKADVLKELPPKQRVVVPLEITNRTEYNRIADDVIDYIRSTEGAEAANKASRAEVLVQFEKLKQAAVRGKLTAAIEWIEDYLTNDPKLVVFADHQATVKALEVAFAGRSVTIDGGTPAAQRQANVDRFMKEDRVQVLIGTKAAKEGLTLTAARATCFVELWWTPGDHDQAEDRVHRIGQEADSVSAYYLLAGDTVEETIAALIDEKRKIIAAVLDGREVEDRDVLSELMKEFKN
jgi:hypothetical protein